MSFYAVAKGTPPGIYRTWEDCKKAINGFTKAKFKKFNTELEAEDFIKSNSDSVPQQLQPQQTQQQTQKQTQQNINTNDITDYYVYTDGSCSKNGSIRAKAGMGIYFGPDDPRNVSECVTGKQTNNTAEISAIIRTYDIIDEDIKLNKQIVICSDSQYAIRAVTTYGEKCDKNNWATQIPNIELVRKVYEIYKNKPNVRFQYIPAHTGKQDIHSLGNDGADKLANNAIGLEQCPYNKVYLEVPYIRKDEAKALGAKWDPKKKKWYATESCENTKTLITMFSENPHRSN